MENNANWGLDQEDLFGGVDLERHPEIHPAHRHRHGGLPNPPEFDTNGRIRHRGRGHVPLLAIKQSREEFFACV